VAFKPKSRQNQKVVGIFPTASLCPLPFVLLKEIKRIKQKTIVDSAVYIIMRRSKKQKATFPACPMPKLKHYQCENIHTLPKKKRNHQGRINFLFGLYWFSRVFFFFFSQHLKLQIEWDRVFIMVPRVFYFYFFVCISPPYIALKCLG
jgi:hypothetical protein